MYIYADYVSTWVDGIIQSNGILSGSITHLITPAQASGNPLSFGEDRYGDQYILFNGNTTVYKLQDTSYQRRPKAYITPVRQGAGLFLLQGLEGKNLTYQWLKDNVIIPGATSPGYTTPVTGSYRLIVTNTLNFKDTSAAFLLGSSLNFISFTAQKVSTVIIKLDWKTSLEQNISGYIIQRRRDNETTFSDLGFIEGKDTNGISNNELDYTFSDSSVSGYSKLFYRLQIQHTDGSYTYSDIRIISSDNTKNGYTLFPNPAKGRVQIYCNDFTVPLMLVIYDHAGKKIKEQLVNQQGSTIELPVSKGVYIVQLSDKDGDNAVRKKLVVQ